MALNKEIRIGNKVIGPGHEPYIIAEMACAHDGDLKKAKLLVDSARDAEADAIQLQFFVSDETVTPHHEAYGILKQIEFTEAQWTELFEYAKQFNIDVFVCTYDLPSVRLAEKLGAKGIKLNSADLVNPEVVAAVSASGIPFTLGTGASTLEEIRRGLETASNHGAKDVILMQGVQNFPTATEDLNISKINLLRKEFGVPVGYADHTAGDDPFGKIVDLIAVGMGANVLEKHVTVDRSEKGIDYQAALEPEEFKLYVQNIRRAFVAVGSGEIKAFNESDLKYRKFQKKSVVAIRDIPAGTKITREDVSFIRNVNPGVPPIDFDKLSGRQTKRDIRKFENIQDEDLQ
ncbi:MAG: N-acetylneuraminate synthase family protein [Flavobacteriales bacterium]